MHPFKIQKNYWRANEGGVVDINLYDTHFNKFRRAYRNIPNTQHVRSCVSTRIDKKKVWYFGLADKLWEFER